jgi:hypothetical protein
LLASVLASTASYGTLRVPLHGIYI